jgi:hypothetical protein
MLMGNLKSLHSLWVNLAKNQRYASFISERDIKTFSERLEHEGLSFLTITLPKIGKALDNFHSTTLWEPPSDFQSDGDGIPLFLGVAVRLALKGSSLAVDVVRQMTLIFYKLEVEYDRDTVAKYLDQFKTTDASLGFGDSEESREEALSLIADMRRMIEKILWKEDPLDIRPCHGSGATACRTANWDKYHLLRYFSKLDNVYSYSDYFFYSLTHLSDELEKLEKSTDSVPMARVVLVPKDSRGPRIISCEPAELLFIQLGIMRKLYRVLENHHHTAGQINFSDQTINRLLARQSSIDGKYSTIDLSDASDRVSLDLVRRVFPREWVECLEACRSEETILPTGEIVKLNKFAPMGSACCFPVEALVFWTCAQAVIRKLRSRSRSLVFVYGDDIIIPSEFFDRVVRGLTSIGLLVNREKSYKSGPFRESCGGDYHNGYDVTPVRVRKFLTSAGTGLATCADLCNLFIAKFGVYESQDIVSSIETSCGYIFPRTLTPLPATVRDSPRASNDVFFSRRWNIGFQRYEHRIISLSCKVLTKQAPNWGELLRKELQRDNPGQSAGEYSHWTKPVEKLLDPGEYADTHSARQKWVWAWLG